MAATPFRSAAPKARDAMTDDRPPADALSVNPERIWTNLRAFARIGYRTGARMYRLAFTRSDLRARQLLLHLMDNLGLETRVDEFGNVFGRLPAPHLSGSAAPVLIGSHLDTVPAGGRFDGSLGVVAALEAVAVIREQVQRLRRPVEVVSFACEESSRFGRGTLGSGLVAGQWDPDTVLALRDAQGRRLADVLKRVGLDPTRVAGVRRAPGDFAAFLEMHIEQGRVLEESEARVGVVEVIAAPTRFHLTLTGQADHSGATPMGLRRDALAGAAQVILAVERAASAVPGVVGTVGTVRVEPGAINVVPGRVELGIDVRATSGESKHQVVERINQVIEEVGKCRGLESSLVPLTDEEAVKLDDSVVQVLESCCRVRDIPHARMPSGAGHDAMQMARICPTGMLLVPSRAGISHDPGEWTDADDVVTGTQVFVDATFDLATRVVL
jgi:beta-ureidopropionase / N-carbamoyl-L-amino-acid hydrolase